MIQERDLWERLVAMPPAAWAFVGSLATVMVTAVGAWWRRREARATEFRLSEDQLFQHLSAMVEALRVEIVRMKADLEAERALRVAADTLVAQLKAQLIRAEAECDSVRREAGELRAGAAIMQAKIDALRGSATRSFTAPPQQ
ncbi:hypothetical protein UFOVP326_115 [uncultured Caudovirales phage]|uniref:Uncharacterized protein n=1 Tax=uncultured Caudovirales phage TaxID=2100421 RepID=A0A6J5LTJ8_9CAUD|nr:hypothetical protein UFOVP326_115 [uncultured Caudovirales phage]